MLNFFFYQNFHQKLFCILWKQYCMQDLPLSNADLLPLSPYRQTTAFFTEKKRKSRTNQAIKQSSPFLLQGLAAGVAELPASVDSFTSVLPFCELSSVDSVLGLVPSACSSFTWDEEGTASSGSTFTSILTSSLMLDGSTSILTAEEVGVTGVIGVVAVVVLDAMAWVKDVEVADETALMFLEPELEASRLVRCMLFSMAGSILGLTSTLPVPFIFLSPCRSQYILHQSEPKSLQSWESTDCTLPSPKYLNCVSWLDLPSHFLCGLT